MNRRMFSLGGLAAAGCASAPAAAPRPVDEAGWMRLNGFEQWVAARGADSRNPVILFLHGGPGLGVAENFPVFEEWTRDFTVVLWDQPGGGATGARNLGRQGELSLDRYARDGIALAERLRTRFGKRKLVLMGISWGTHLGVEMVHRRPDLFSCYVGTAQVVGRRGHQAGYDLALKTVRERGDKAAEAALLNAGPPPFRSYEHFVLRQFYTNPPYYQPTSQAETAATADVARLRAARPADATYVAFKTPPAGFNAMQMFSETQQVMQPKEGDWEIRDYGLDWPIPMFVFQGEHDFNAIESLAREWAAEIQAPQKAYEVIPGAGHNTALFHRELHALLRKHVLPVLKA